MKNPDQHRPVHGTYGLPGNPFKDGAYVNSGAFSAESSLNGKANNENLPHSHKAIFQNQQPIMKTTFQDRPFLGASLRSSFAKLRSVVAILVVVGGFGAIKVQAAVLVGWDFDPQLGGANNFGPSALSPSTTAANVTGGNLTRGTGIGTTGTGAANAWGGNNFIITGQNQANAIAANEFATFSVTAQAGFVVSVSGIGAYNIRRSGTGPTTGIWQYDAGAGFTDIGSAITWGTTTTPAGNAQSAISLSGISALQTVAAGTTLTFRLVTWGASNAGGTWYLNDPAGAAGDDFTLLGAVAVPEPTMWAMMAFGTIFGAVQLVRLYRRHLAAAC